VNLVRFKENPQSFLDICITKYCQMRLKQREEHKVKKGLQITKPVGGKQSTKATKLQMLAFPYRKRKGQLRRRTKNPESRTMSQEKEWKRTKALIIPDPCASCCPFFGQGYRICFPLLYFEWVSRRYLSVVHRSSY
jgi:hypothetical protein